uniref:Mitochondrial carrier protein n=1 Tax=Guillardia theta TaxID=55529 RepID=A0A7S4KEW4_GUITH|mmetsp:Transcript_23799/g.77554  ORF Transcript_23799/g.77554 Transcript_23799/m.77554 type:complete len:351 (+) Transcript_23799:312-1364(+)
MVAQMRQGTDPGIANKSDHQQVGNPAQEQSYWKNAVAGLSGGFVSAVVMHPLDVVNTRFQVQDGKLSHIPVYRSTAHAIVTIVKTEGPASLYAGLGPNLVGSTVSWGCYFYGYKRLREFASSHLPRPKDAVGMSHLGPGVNLACATAAGVVTAAITQPIWLAKVRLQLQHGSGFQYNGMHHVMTSVVQHEGLFALWRGLLPSLLLVSHVSIHFAVYEEIKKLVLPYGPTEDRLYAWQTFLVGSTAKMFSSVLTYPFQVIRSRMQQLDPTVVAERLKQMNQNTEEVAVNFQLERNRRYYRGPVDTVSKIFHGEGLQGFYKGLGSNLLRVVPTAAITFVVYEYVTMMLGASS